MESIDSALAQQREYFSTGKTKDLKFRIQVLKRLRRAIKEHESDILKALKKDLNKAEFESYKTELGIVLGEISYHLKNLGKWARPRRVPTPIMHFPARSTIYAEAYGVVLIMASWNYPFQLTLMPLIGAVSAGNCCIVKPSEYSPYTAGVIREIVSKVFDKSHVIAVCGGIETSKFLLDQRFDYIFFTGSPRVGRIVMERAAKNLTPITLELGGKSPCIVDETANIKLAAKRIVWGKFLNAGQTCVAPDYLLVQKDIKEKLIGSIEHYIKSFYGEAPLLSEDYPKIISKGHYDRLSKLMYDGNIIIGGQKSADTRQIAPTVLTGVSWDSPVMQEEIFGPILPIIAFDNLDRVWDILAAKPKPLALYIFTTSKEHERKAISRSSFGGCCINDTVIHLVNPNLPFGGVGESGMGGYHGKRSFDTFTHYKGVMKKSNLIDINLRYPPYGDSLSLLRRIMK